MEFTDMISDLLQRGYTLQKIGDAIGTTESNVRAMLTNSRQRPRWDTGDKLITLHKKTMRKYPKVNTTV